MLPRLRLTWYLRCNRTSLTGDRIRQHGKLRAVMQVCTPWIKNGLIDKDRLLALRRRRSFFAGQLPPPRGGLWARF